MKPGALRIVIIGAGKIAYSLASALNKNEFKITAVISRNKKSASNLSKKFNIPFYSDSLKTIPPESNFFILSVPDNEIKITAGIISGLDINFKKSAFIHLSGVETIDSLRSIKDNGGRTGSLHIMQTFPSKKIIDIKGAYAAIESADNELRKLLFSVSGKMGLHPFSIGSEKKVLYHLAGVYASNFLTGNMFIAGELFREVSGAKKMSDVMRPIISTALTNILLNGAVNSLSGPVDRGDMQTIVYHLDALDMLIKTGRPKKYIKLLKNNYISQSLNLLALIEKRDGQLTGKHLKIKKMLTSKLQIKD